ncbi:MAG: hypothetical protein WKG01_19960 [Kofleriaceae bacterium]
MGPGLKVGSAAGLIGAGFAIGAQGGPGVIEVPGPATVVTDPCSVPAGMTLETLPAHDRVQLMRRVLACQDRYHGFITPDQYDKTIAAIDASWLAAAVEPAIASTPIWASTVRGFSTQYTEDAWSARQVLGAPDVYPGTGDHEHAWASETADDRAEWLEVGFAQPRAISGVELYETFNPGAVGRVELITTTGRRIEVAVDRQQTARHLVPVTCTSEPIAAVRVHLDSKAVEGWNEIDAIGVVPCT